MNIEEKLEHLPDHPGVYLMKDDQGKIIYVGKAASLKNRVRSYFHGQHPPRTEAMVRRVADLEYILTDSEVEALVLECNLIKRHRPYYNINLKDDKSYPYLKVTVQEEFPRIQVTRQPLQDGSRYFGPYTRVSALKETLKLLRALFPVRTCRETPLQPKSRPCLNAHIRRCPAPCTGKVNPEEYRRAVEALLLFMEGKQDDLVKEIKRQMNEAAARLEFERAAILRDQLQAITDVLAEQRVASTDGGDRDALAVAREGDEAVGMIFFVRDGKVIGSEHFFLDGAADQSQEEIMAAFVKQYYSNKMEIPAEILLEYPPEDSEVIRQWLSQKLGRKVQLKVPRRGGKLKLIKMVAANAAQILSEHRLARQLQAAAGEAALMELQQFLGLEKLPRRMEAYDISHIQGSEQVGAMAVFVDGRPQPGAYRRFRIKTVAGADDYAALREVLARRFRRLGDERFGDLPDLVLIDGGRGQLNAAREIMLTLGVGGIPTFSLAKEEELLFSPDNPVPLALPRDSRALRLLQHLRDEVHRFAVTYHRQIRAKTAYRSILDEIPGIGPKRKRALLQHFGSLEGIRRASLEDLLKVKGMDRRAAGEILRYFGGTVDARD
ncbi:MAG: excinuclease subunit [Clostridia bacterium]|nr:excinuclease subunit [Clostridia bacterium]